MKHLLALDGGGIRGVFSLTILERVEALLREDSGNKDLLLSEYFDYVGGTSTGAIIATCLAWGLSVEEVMELYIGQSAQMFQRQGLHKRLMYKYHAKGLAATFRDLFKEDDGSESKLGTEKLKTHLLVVTRNASTGSPWPITNNPKAMFNEKGAPGCNLELPLWQLVRASTAAPGYFPPEIVTIHGEGDRFSPGVECAFEDGGVTPHNNPAYLLYLKATLPEYRMGWERGRGVLSLLSLGTGRVPTGRERHRINLLQAAASVPGSLISSFVTYQDQLCRVNGECRYGEPIDGELGDMRREDPEADFVYARYDHAFTESELKEVEKYTKKGFTLDNMELVPFLLDFGRAYAERTVKLEHFHLGYSR